MRFIAFLCSVSVLSASTWTVCKSGGGCNYTTINGAIQDSVNVHCGDTVQIKAGQGSGTGSNGTPSGWYCGGNGICNANNPVVFTQNCPAANPLTVMSDQTSALPPANVRITPAYADGASPVVPTIYNPGNGLLLYAAPGNGGTAAGGIRIIGVQLCCFANFSDFVPLGSRGQGTLDSQLNVVSDIPTNITLDRVILRTDPTQNTRKCITYDAIGLNILNSWVDCAYDQNSSDSQAIAGYMGQGKILNSYISGSTETLTLGGAMPPVITPIVAGVKTDNWEVLSAQLPGPLEFAWNEITKPRWIYSAGIGWTANTQVPKGQIIHDAAGDNAPVLQALNSGTTGNIQPVWPPVCGTITDGSVTWQRYCQTYGVSSASWSSGTVTITTSSANAVLVGDHINVTGITPTGYNATNVVATAESPGTVSYALASNPGAYSSGGTLFDHSDTQDNVKNLFECKDCTGLNMHDNFFHRSWPQGQQGYAITLTSSPAYAGAQQVTNVTLRNNYFRDIGAGINTSGQDTVNDLNAVPSIMTGVGPWNITSSNNKLSLTIDGGSVAITLTTGTARTAANVQSDLTAAFTTAGLGIACLDNLGAVILRGRAPGDGSSCSGSAMSQPLDLTHYIQVNSTANDAWATLTASRTPGTAAATEGVAYGGCNNPRSLVWYGCGVFNGLRVQNNLFRNMNSATFFTGVLYTFAVFQHEQNTQYAHNTIDANYGTSNTVFGANLTDTWFLNLETFASGFPPFNVLVRDNIIGWKGPNFNPSGGVVGFTAQGGSELDFSAINGMFCQPVFIDSIAPAFTDSTCPAGVFSHNLIPGAHLYSSPTRNTSPFVNDLGYNSYPSDNYNATDFNLDPVTLRWTNPAGPATDTTVPGVDPTQIPRILNPALQVSDRAAVVSYQLSESSANSGYNCIAYATTRDSSFYTQPVNYDANDSSPVIADMDPSLYNQPDWDGNDKFPQAGNLRQIIIGLNSALTAGTTYYVRVACPGASWPEDGTSASFTTKAAETGTAMVPFKRTPLSSVGAIASMKVTYGSAYSRSSGTISGAGTGSASCTAGSTCVVNIGVTHGAPLYYQVQYLTSGAAVLYSEPVGTMLP